MKFKRLFILGFIIMAVSLFGCANLQKYSDAEREKMKNADWYAAPGLGPATVERSTMH